MTPLRHVSSPDPGDGGGLEGQLGTEKERQDKKEVRVEHC